MKKRKIRALAACILLLATAGALLVLVHLPEPAEPVPPLSDAAKPFAVAGNTVVFGTYEQDGEPGPDPIEWVVAETRGGKSLLVSRWGLDAMPYNDRLAEVTWESCSLRKWMNDAFLETAFTDAERQAILLSHVDNSKAQGYKGRDGGPDTQDRLFLLSYAEVWKYFPTRQEKKSRPTEYARTRGAFRNYMSQEGWWWLRSPGREPSYAMCVNYVGTFYHNHVHNDYDFVRPAMWVDLTKL